MTVSLFFFFLFQVSLLFASEEGHSGQIPWTEILFSAINFLLFLYIVVRFTKEPILRFLAERRESILKSLGEAATGLQQSEIRLSRVRHRLQNFDQEIAELRSLSDREMERERQRLIGQAAGVAARIRRDAETVAQQEALVAKQKLGVEFAEMAVERARQLLPDRLTPEVRRRLSEEFLSSLEAGAWQA